MSGLRDRLAGKVTVGDDGFVREDPVDSYRMPLMEHLVELRKRVIYSLVALLIASCVCFGFAPEIWAVLVEPMNSALHETGRGFMAMTSPIEGFMTYMRVAALAAIALAAPVMFYQIWKFIAPGLYPKEQRLVIPLVASSTALFLAGGAFCYLVVFRFAFPLFLTVTTEDVQAVVSMDSYLSVAGTLLLSFGLAFQLPVVVYLLSVMGLINHRDMVRMFRYAMVGIAVASAIITPTTDVLSQALLAIPLAVLYVLSIGVSWMFSTKKVTPPGDSPAPGADAAAG